MISEDAQNFISPVSLESVEPAAKSTNRAGYPKIENLLNEKTRIAALYEDISTALAAEGRLQTVLKRCARLLANRLDAAFAGIWTRDAGENILELQAHAGQRRRPAAEYAKIPVGHGKIGLIANKRVPALVNELSNDPAFAGQDWIKREKVAAFAGFPLIVEKRLVGVVCIFTRRPLTESTFQALETVARAIANVIGRRKSEEARHELLEKLKNARESERRHLSRELHDEVAQQLVVASMRLQRAEKQIVKLLPDEHSLIADLVIAQELLLRNQQSLRLMAHALHSQILEHFGLPEALRRFIADIKILAGEKSTSIAFDYPPDFPRLTAAIETDLYRTVQEAVSNAIKHAHAKLISLELKSENDAVCIVIKDDGDGFRTDEPASDGIGFASMRERAELIGSKLKISSRIGTGTEISLRVPLPRNRRRSAD